MATKIFILGMNAISVSLGLTMKKSGDLIERTGFDPDISSMKTAVRMGAVDRAIESLTVGSKDADIIIYSLPPGQILDVIKSIRSNIKSGCVFIYMDQIGHDTFTLLSENLTDPNAFIAWVPAINPKYMREQELGIKGAQADLFLNSHVYIAGAFNTRPAVLKAGGDLAILAGALPLFIDADELAGILTLSHDFPRLMAAVITRLTTSEPGWNEARKLAGHDFDNLSAPLTSLENQNAPETTFYANRKNLQRLILLMIKELQQMHDSLEDEKDPVLGASIKNAIVARQVWCKQRMDMSWLEKRPIDPDAPHSISEMMLGKRRKKS